jgi:hypothetical protein
MNHDNDNVVGYNWWSWCKKVMEIKVVCYL